MTLWPSMLQHCVLTMHCAVADPCTALRHEDAASTPFNIDLTDSSPLAPCPRPSSSPWPSPSLRHLAPSPPSSLLSRCPQHARCRTSHTRSPPHVGTSCRLWEGRVTHGRLRIPQIPPWRSLPALASSGMELVRLVRHAGEPVLTLRFVQASSPALRWPQPFSRLCSPTNWAHASRDPELQR